MAKVVIVTSLTDAREALETLGLPVRVRNEDSVVRGELVKDKESFEMEVIRLLKNAGRAVEIRKPGLSK